MEERISALEKKVAELEKALQERPVEIELTTKDLSKKIADYLQKSLSKLYT